MEILNEVHRLKTDGVLSNLATFSPSKNEFAPTCRGKLTVSGIAVKLKRDFVTNALSGDIVYHFMTLLKHHRYQVEASNVVSVGPGVGTPQNSKYFLRFPNTFTLEDLEPDFEAKLEVYVLQTQREFLPHDAKYHIKKVRLRKFLSKLF
jgi:hypothetical protein